MNHSKPHNWSLSFSLRFSSKKSQSQQDHSFYNTVFIKKLTHFTNHNSLNIVKNILPQQSEKPYSL